MRSRSFARVSMRAFSAGTCSATLAGSKSSMWRNFRFTPISLPSPASVFSTFMLRPGAMRAMTSLKLSRSICVNLRSASGFSGSLGSPAKSPMTPTMKGSSRSMAAPSVSTS